MPTVIVINAKDKTIYETDMTGYPDMVKLLPGGICIADRLHNGDVLYVDDEALLRPAECAFRWKSRADCQPMMSSGIIQGADEYDTRTQDEKTTDCKSSCEEIEAMVEWMTIPEALEWFRDRDSETAVSITDLTDGSVTHVSSWGDVTKELHKDGK